MKGVKLVRIRWKKGTERIEVNKNDTIGTLLDYMNKKYPGEINDDGLTLTQERTKTVLQKRIKLSSLDLENGELFVLYLPLQRNSSQQSARIESLNQQEFRPSTCKNAKRIGGENVKTVEELSAMHPTIKFVKSTECKTKRIWFPIREIEGIRKISNALHFNSTRVMLLYGTHTNQESYSVHAVTMPTQEYDGKTLTINESHIKSSNDLSVVLGIKLIGALLIAPKSEIVFPAPVFMSLASVAKDVLNQFILIRVNSSLTEFRPDNIPIQLEAYAISEQFVQLYKDGLFTGETTHTSCLTKERITAGGKIGKEVDVSFFITPVPIKQRVGWFPRCSFPFQCFFPTVADFVEVMEKDFEAPNFVRLLDFNLLLYLEGIFSKEKDLPLIARKCIAKEEMPDNVLVKIDEIVDSKLRLLNK